MTVAHCKDPARCSVCTGVTPRVVTTIAGVTALDGVPVDDTGAMAAVQPQPRGRKHRYGRGKR